MLDEAEDLHERLLVLRAQLGDGEAFAEIVERFSGRLRYFLRKMLGDAHAADDSLQEVWLSAFRALPRLKDPKAFPAWIYRIARDRVSGELRRSWRRHAPLEEAADSTAAEEPEFGPEDAGQVHARLDELAPEAREVLLLRFIEDLSYEEIALVVGLPVGTVRSRIHHAKKALRGAMERKGSDG